MIPAATSHNGGCAVDEANAAPRCAVDEANASLRYLPSATSPCVITNSVNGIFDFHMDKNTKVHTASSGHLGVSE